MPQTLAERYAEALVAKGHTEVITRSRKYRCFSGPHPGLFFYIGKAGSLRVGRCRTESHPVSDRVKRALLDATPTRDDICRELGI